MGALGGAAALALAIAGPVSAAPSLGTPAGQHVVAVTTSSLTVGLRPVSGAKKYKLYVSPVKADLFYQNLHNGSTQRKSATSTTPRITVGGLAYTTKPYYYRVEAIDGTRATFASTYPIAYLRPSAPTSLAVSQGAGGGTSLAWHSVAVTGSLIQQATDSGFTQGLRTYKMGGASKTFTPYGLTAGQTYYFRVRGVNSGVTSAPSAPTSAWTAAGNESSVRVITYNSLDAKFDTGPASKHPGGYPQAFIPYRLDAQLYLLNSSAANADVIGIQEASTCLHKVYVNGHPRPCFRQIDALLQGDSNIHGLAPRYSLADTDSIGSTTNRYYGNYILYDASTVTPVGPGGHWAIGPSSSERYATYQVFRIKATGATFLYVTTHLVSPAGPTYDKQRNAESKTMIADATAYAGNKHVGPIVYTGDFNSYPEAFRTVDTPGNNMRAIGMSDGIKVAQSKTNAQYDSINQLYRKALKGLGSADHVYVTPGVGVPFWGELLRLSSGKFVGPIPSDHNPVVSTLEIPY